MNSFSKPLYVWLTDTVRLSVRLINYYWWINSVCNFFLLLLTGVWSPVGTPEAERKKFSFTEESTKKEDKKDKTQEDESGSVVWTPRSAGASPQFDRKKYRPINFQSPPPQRKQLSKHVWLIYIFLCMCLYL